MTTPRMSTGTIVAWRTLALSAVALSCLGWPVVHAQLPVAGASDSLVLAALVRQVDDSSAATRDMVTAALRARASVYLPMLERWARSSDEQFAQRAGTAIGRSGTAAHDVLRRFAREPAMDHLSGAMIERIAIWAIPTSAELLEVLDPLLRNTDATQRYYGVRALERFGADATNLAPALLRALEDSSAAVRKRALWELRPRTRSDQYDARIAARLVELIDSPDSDERAQALARLSSFHPHGVLAVPKAKRLAESSEEVSLRLLAVGVLVRQEVAPRELVPILVRLLHDPEADMRRSALLSIGTVGLAGLAPDDARAVVDTVERFLWPRARAMPEDAGQVLIALGVPARDALARALQSGNIRVQLLAVRGLSHFGDDSAVDRPLLDALGDGQPIVREMAGLALVGAARRVEEELARLAAGASTVRAEAAQHSLTMIRAVRTVGVANLCYAVTYGPWVPAIPSDRVTLLKAPRRVRFRTGLAPPSYDLVPRMFIVEQEIGGAWNADGRWSPNATHTDILVDGAVYGSDVSLTIRPESDGSLVGTAKTYWDGYGGETQASRVRLTPIACGVP